MNSTSLPYFPFIFHQFFQFFPKFGAFSIDFSFFFLSFAVFLSALASTDRRSRSLWAPWRRERPKRPQSSMPCLGRFGFACSRGFRKGLAFLKASGKFLFAKESLSKSVFNFEQKRVTLFFLKIKKHLKRKKRPCDWLDKMAQGARGFGNIFPFTNRGFGVSDILSQVKLQTTPGKLQKTLGLPQKTLIISQQSHTKKFQTILEKP